MDPITLAIMLGGFAAKAITGGFQASRARRGLKALRGQAMPQFNITPEQQRSYNRAEEFAGTGYSGAERAALNQNIARGSNLAYRRATDIGGGSGARAIQGAIGASGLGAQNQLAMNDALLRRRNMQYADQVGSSLSAQRNMETSRAFNYRMELERSLGAAKTQGIENIVNAFGGAAATAAYGGFGGTGGTGRGFSGYGGNQSQTGPGFPYPQPIPMFQQNNNGGFGPERQPMPGQPDWYRNPWEEPLYKR